MCGEEVSQTCIVALVKQAHGAGDGRLARRGVHVAGEPKARQRVLEHADVADTNLPALKAGGVEHVDRRCEHFSLSERARYADEFHTVLEKFPVAPGLEFLVAVALTVVGKAERFGVHSHFFGDHAHDGCRQLGAQGQVPFALVLEGIELVDDARAGFGGEQLKGFKHRRLDPRKSVALRHVFEQVLQRQTSLHRRWREVPGPARSLHHIWWYGRMFLSSPLNYAIGVGSIFIYSCPTSHEV